MGRRDLYRSVAKKEKEIPGCMSGMLQFLDFHHILFSQSCNKEPQEHSPPRLQQYSHQLKGVEAPRNSLELDEAAAATTTTAATASAIAEQYYGIPIGVPLNAKKNKQRNKRKELQVVLAEEEKRNSQCETPRTPNVVAKLMGLEILPDGASTPTLGPKSQGHSPKIAVTKKKKHSSDVRQPLQKRDTNLLPNVRRLELGTRSLPDTPRASSERSRDADPRLSLQVNKENYNRAKNLCDVSHSVPLSPTGAYVSRSRKKDDGLKTQDEKKSPRSRYYAREIVKQVKENIHRRGSSTSSSVDDENAVRSRRTRPADKTVLVESNETEQHFTAKPSPSTSPPLPPPSQKRYAEPLKPARRPFKFKENADAKPIKMATGSKKTGYEKFTDRIRKQPPPSETATQSLPSPNHVAIILPQKHDFCSEKTKNSYTVTTGCCNREASNRRLSRSPVRIRSDPVIPSQGLRVQKCTRLEQEAEFFYVRSILERAGIMNSTQVRWYSPSLPIDPFIFHQLELDLPNLPGQLRHRCNRKLIFHLVEEILSDLLTFSSSASTHPTKPQHRRLHEINKELLFERLWTRIRSYPLADCQVIEDIDALVAGDLAEASVRQLLGHPLVVAEAQRILLEIEADVTDSVFGEVAGTLAARCSRF